MPYSSFSLCGAWEMDYQEDKYTSTVIPDADYTRIENCVPGYWEDMTESFQRKVNEALIWQATAIFHTIMIC